MEIVDHSQTRQRPGQKRRGSPCPGLEKALGAVEMLLVPSDRKNFDSPASVAELVSKLPVSLGTDHLAAQVRSLSPGSGLLEYPDDLLFGK